MEIDPNMPVNKTAALVVSKSSEQGSDFRCGAVISSMTPLPTRIWHGRPQDDLVGRKVGDFVVVGCALWMPNNFKTSTNNTRWVVKCKCGRYQMLTTKTVKKAHMNNACVECKKIKK